MVFYGTRVSVATILAMYQVIYLYMLQHCQRQQIAPLASRISDDSFLDLWFDRRFTLSGSTRRVLLHGRLLMD
jgi:hypothetical protein